MRSVTNSATISDWKEQRTPVADAPSDHAINVWQYAKQRQKDAVAFAAYEQEQLMKEMEEHRNYTAMLENEKFEVVDVEVAVDEHGDEVEIPADEREHQPEMMTGTEMKMKQAVEGEAENNKGMFDEDEKATAAGNVGDSNTTEQPKKRHLPKGAVKWETRKKKIPRERPYIRSVEYFDRHVTLDQSYSGSADNRIIGRFENIWFNYIRYYFTREILIGKDRYGVRFFVRWVHTRIRHEQRLCRRRDKNKRHQPYGALMTDELSWFRWSRQQRQDPPTVAEEEFRRRHTTEFMGPVALGNESVENMMMRNISTLGFGPMVQELDDDKSLDDPLKKNIHVYNRDPKEEHAKREKEKRATWTGAFVKGDLFYNEEEVQSMRQELGHIFRDKEWQELELKRQHRSRTIANAEEDARAQLAAAAAANYNSEMASGGRKPTSPLTDTDPVNLDDQGHWKPPRHEWHRTDRNMPYYGGVADLTTPELERLRLETGQLEEERSIIRKELGITDVGDMKEGRDPIDKGLSGQFSVPDTRSDWKPKVWSEPWGTGGGFRW